MLPNATATCEQTVSIASNNGSATLTVADKDTDTNLTHTNGTDTIATAAGAVAQGTSSWNISVADTSVTNAAMVASTGTPIEIFSGAISGADKTFNITYNFGTAANQAAGTYSDMITYTVSAL